MAVSKAWKNFGKCLKESMERIKKQAETENLSVSISPGNTKMGMMPSISFPAWTTCVKCDCNKSCYATCGYQAFPPCMDSYSRNLWVLKHEPDRFWRTVEASIMTSRFFRYFAAGDIPDYDFFCHMADIARRNPHNRQLCFTKKYDIVNKWMEENGELPQNLQVIFSGWKGLHMSNPFLLPECHIRYEDGTTTADVNKYSFRCSGNCTECFITNCGCFSLMKNQQVIINQH